MWLQNLRYIRILTVLIITPFFNSFKHFKKTYFSVTNQSHKDFEWIIIDDKSKDTERDKLINLVSKDERVRLIHNSDNIGAGASRNVGLSFFNHEYLAFIDSDDYWDEEFLTKMLVHQAEVGCRLVFSGYRRFMFDQNSFMSDYSYSGSVDHDLILKGNPISCLSALMKPDKSFELPRFGRIKTRNDLVFFYEFLKLYGKGYGVSESLATYVLRSKSLSRNKVKTIGGQWFVYRKVAKKNCVVSAYYLLCWALYGVIKYLK